MSNDALPIPDLPETSSELAMTLPGRVSIAPPHPLDGEWMMQVDNLTYGPFTGRELEAFAAEGRLEYSSRVRRLPGGNWSMAGADTALRGLFDAGKPPLTASRASNPPPVTAAGGSTIVQVTNHIGQPHAFVGDMGADKSPGVALLLSLLFVGAGQLYNGDVGKGILMFFGCVLMWMVLLGWIFNIWSMIDAYSRAKDLRQRHQIYLANVRRT
jgi:TM2 domain-containing membrane protein YozV